MAPKQFEATVEANERGNVQITIPFDPSAEWGRRQRHYVSGTINGTPFNGSLGARAGRVFMPLNKEFREAARIDVGDVVTVVMESAEPARAELPPDLEEALAGEPAARKFLDGLSAFYRGEYVMWIVGARRPETRAARVAEVVTLLRDGEQRRR
jgi:hypothetical protein